MPKARVESGGVHDAEYDPRHFLQVATGFLKEVEQSIVFDSAHGLHAKRSIVGLFTIAQMTASHSLSALTEYREGVDHARVYDNCIDPPAERTKVKMLTIPPMSARHFLTAHSERGKEVDKVTVNDDWSNDLQMRSNDLLLTTK